jgi:hypothetical protein
MNAPDNKRMLWDLTNHLYKAWMSRDQVIALFEKTIVEFDTGSDPLMEKNKRFLSAYVDRVEAIQPADSAQRAAMFEERLKMRHQALPPKKTVSFEPEVIEIVAVPEKTTSSPEIKSEVLLLKEEIHVLKDRLSKLEKYVFKT